MIHTVFKGEIVFARLLLPLVAGISMAMSCFKSVLLYQVSSCLCLLFSLILFVLWLKYRDLKVYFYKWLPGLCVQLLLLVLGCVITLNQSPFLHAGYFINSKKEALVVGISSEPRSSGGIVRFEAKVCEALTENEFEKSRGKLLVAVKTGKKSFFQYGDRLLIPYKFREVDPPYNPNEFDYKNYLAGHGIYHQTFINSNEVKLLEPQRGDPLITYAQQLRKKMVAGFSRYITEKNASALASTLILGYRADLSPDVLEAYSKTGTMHVLSVSGMHVALVLIILTRLLSFMDKNKKLKLIKALLIIILIWFYALITGFSPSVCRAALMISMLITGKTINRRANSYNSVAVSALLLLIYNPFFLADAGFQLSYLAVLGLIYLYPKIYHLFYINNWLADKIWSYTSLSIAAQLATAPLSVYYFHQFPVYFLLSNLFVVIPISLIMYSGLAFLFIYFLSGFFPVLHFLLKPAGNLLAISINWVNKGLYYIENLSGSSIDFYPYHFSYYLITFLACLLFVIAFQFGSKRNLYCSLVLFSGIISYTSYAVIRRQDQKIITFYSLRKSMAVSMLDGEKAGLVFPQKDEKAFSFSIKPHLKAYSNEIYFLSAPSHDCPFICYRDNFIQFYNYKILIWNKVINKYVYKKPVKVDVVLITGNPSLKLKDISEIVSFRQIVIDATNADYRSEQWLKQAKALNIPCYLLKRNPAFIINL